MATLAANATSPEAKKARNDEACSTAETFVNLYYERVDSKRHLIGMFDSLRSRLSLSMGLRLDPSTHVDRSEILTRPQ